jgi:hypothetical protein
MDRRSFLIGTGSLLTTAYLEKADWFLRNKNSVVPLIQPEKATGKLYFVNTGFEHELRFDTPDFNLPDVLTYREALERYYGYDLPKDQLTPLSIFKDIHECYGVRPKQLDDIVEDDFYFDAWARKDSNNARAFHFLYDLDLFGSDDANGLRRGDLQFIDGYHPGNEYLGVTSHDPISASLLQARLLELGYNLSVELADET